MNTTDRNDLFFKTIKEEYARLGKVPVITRSSLRLELPMQPNTTEYVFKLKKTETSPMWNIITPTEQRLDQNDNFHFNEVAMYIALTTTFTDTNYSLKTYPAESEWGAAAAADINNLYNGVLNINVQGVDVLKLFRLSKFFKVPQTQRLSIAANTNRDERNLEEDSLIEMSPSIMLSGENTNKITINLPNAIVNSPINNNGRVLLIVDGLLAQNASKK